MLHNKIFRLVLYDTFDTDDKYAADKKYEYLGDMEDIWTLWFALHNKLKYPHVEVYSLEGTIQKPEKGIAGLTY